jgi:hypothetical protein
VTRDFAARKGISLEPGIAIFHTSFSKDERLALRPIDRNKAVANPPFVKEFVCMTKKIMRLFQITAVAFLKNARAS